MPQTHHYILQETDSDGRFKEGDYTFTDPALYCIASTKKLVYNEIAAMSFERFFEQKGVGFATIQTLMKNHYGVHIWIHQFIDAAAKRPKTYRLSIHSKEDLKARMDSIDLKMHEMNHWFTTSSGPSDLHSYSDVLSRCQADAQTNNMVIPCKDARIYSIVKFQKTLSSYGLYELGYGHQTQFFIGRNSNPIATASEKWDKANCPAKECVTLSDAAAVMGFTDDQQDLWRVLCAEEPYEGNSPMSKFREKIFSVTRCTIKPVIRLFINGDVSMDEILSRLSEKDVMKFPCLYFDNIFPGSDLEQAYYKTMPYLHPKAFKNLMDALPDIDD